MSGSGSQFGDNKQCLCCSSGGATELMQLAQTICPDRDYFCNPKLGHMYIFLSQEEIEQFNNAGVTAKIFDPEHDDPTGQAKKFFPKTNPAQHQPLGF